MTGAVFGNPLFAWLALAAAAIPLLIHLLNRQRHREIPWAAMRFLLAANRKSIRRTRLEQWLLLALRTLLILIVPLAMARPHFSAGHAAPLIGRHQHHIIVIDNSLSLSAPAVHRTPQVSGLTRHLTAARALLDNLADGDPVSVITMSYPARLLNADPSRTRTRARQLLEQITPQDTRGDLSGALSAVMAILDDPATPALDRTVHVFSDFTPGLFGTPVAGADVDRSLQSLADTVSRAATLTLYPLPQTPWANQSVSAVHATPRMVGAGYPVRISGAVTNHGPQRSAERRMALAIDGRVIGQHTIPALDPAGRHTAETTVEFDVPGLHTIECTLADAGDGDGLAGDDIGRLVVQVREHIPILIVDGKPGARALDGQAGYLSTALAPQIHPDQHTLLRPTVIAEHELPGIDLADFDVVVLCNVRRLAPAEWQRLHTAVEGGRGLLMFMGDLIDVEHYNTIASSLLPGRLAKPAHSDSGTATAVRFDPRSVRAPLDAYFAARESSGLFLVGVHNYMTMAEVDGLVASAALLTYDNGAPAILTRTVGAGHAVVVTTSANMDWSNLPAKGDFVTLTVALIRHLAPPNAPSWNTTAGHTVHSPAAVSSPAAAAEARLRAADGTVLTPHIAALDDGFHSTFDGVTHSGWYTLEGPIAEGPVAVNPDSTESNLQRLDDAAIMRQLGCPLNIVAPRSDLNLLGRTAAAGLAPTLIYGALLLMFAEAFAALWFGRIRK